MAPARVSVLLFCLFFLWFSQSVHLLPITVLIASPLQQCSALPPLPGCLCLHARLTSRLPPSFSFIHSKLMLALCSSISFLWSSAFHVISPVLMASFSFGVFSTPAHSLWCSDVFWLILSLFVLVFVDLPACAINRLFSNGSLGPSLVVHLHFGSKPTCRALAPKDSCRRIVKVHTSCAVMCLDKVTSANNLTHTCLQQDFFFCADINRKTKKKSLTVVHVTGDISCLFFI